MADVELILKVDNVSAITSIKETELALAELKQTSEGGSDEHINLLKKQISILDTFKKKTKEAEATQEEYNEVVDDTATSSDKAGASIGGMGKRLGGIAAIATVVIASLRALVTAFKETNAGMNVMIKTGNVFRQLMYDIVTLNFKNGDSMAKGLDIARKQIALQNQQIASIKSLANYQVLYNKYMADANNVNKNANDRLKDLASATGLYNSIMNTKVALAKEEWLLANDDLANKPKSHKLQQKTNELYSAFILLQQEQILNNDRLKEQELGIKNEVYQKAKDKYLAEIQAANDAYDKRLADQKKFQDLALKLVDEYIQSEINLLKGPERLEAEKNYALGAQKAILDEMEKLGTITPAIRENFKGIVNNIWKAYWDEVENKIESDNGQTASRYVELMLNNVDFKRVDLSNKLQPFGGTSAKSQTTIWDTLGLNPDTDEGKRNIENAKQTVDIIVDMLDYMYSKRVEDATRTRELYDRKVLDLQHEVEMEVELTRMGYASNLNLKQQELAAIEKERQKALEQEKKAIEQQRKYELILQELSLASSAAIIIKKSIEDEGPILGLILAALQVASMFVLWDQYKAQAESATKLAEGGSGTSTGMVTGKSHAQGGERFLDHVEVESGEKWGVLSKRASGKYGDVFDYMVDSFNKDKIPEVFSNVAVNVDNNGSNSRLDRVIEEQKKMNEKWGKDTHVIIQGNKRIITKGDKTRIIG